MERLRRWAKHRLTLCSSSDCGHPGPRECSDPGRKEPESSKSPGKSYRIDLRGANLQKAKLRDFEFPRINLREADLRGANLQGADLRGVTLTNANLSGILTNLEEADLRGATLPNACLKGTNLRGADLGGALISEVNLQGAFLENLRNWQPLQLQSTYWDESTMWPEGYIPPCPHNLPDDRCKADCYGRDS